MKYIVYWRNSDTGQEGHGNPIDEVAARAWVEKNNKEYRGLILHWCEPAPEPTL